MRYFSLIVLFLAISSSLFAKTLHKNDVPKPLKPWVDWVLFDQLKRDCPFIYSNYAAKKCAWPARIELNISSNRARFAQTWQVFEASWIVLPGSKKHWPQNISVNNKLALVTERHKQPAIFLQKGKYQIKGNFYWEAIPESLQVPTDTALVNLYIKGVKVAAPVFNQQGQIWLTDKNKVKAAKETDTLNLSVYRLLNDKIPMRIVTKLDFQVSGSAREINLGQVLLDKQMPISISSALPALLSSNGELRLQVKPGRWVVTITSRATTNITSLKMNKRHAEHWPANEIWAFKAQNHLRTVKLEGATRIDPRQTNSPKEWKNYPSFKLADGSQLVLKQTRRGDEHPQADVLNLKRQMWLDFDGKGYTIKDDIKGSITQSWRLETLAELDLGRVAIDNIPQFITHLKDKDNTKGVEIRRGALNLTADSRYQGNVQNMSATGWNHEFKSVATTLHLPPGWRVFSASGIDNVPQTWLQKWSLLDIFIVLIISIAIARLWSWPWGLLGLTTMALIWHESGLVPQFIWLNLLAVIALLKVVPEGRFKKSCVWYRNSSFIFLLLISIPFMVAQVRTAIYPQLEKSWLNVANNNVFSQAHLSTRKKEVAEINIDALQAESSANTPSSLKSDIAAYSAKRISKNVGYDKERKRSLQSFDPKTNLQTGPGLPQWKWNTVKLNWNGPVQKGQTISLVLISPVAHTLLNFARVFLVALLCLLLLKSIINIPISWIPRVSKLLLLFAIMPVLTLNPSDGYAKTNATPSEKILVELKTRLTQPPECLPTCAQIQSMVLRVDRQQMQIKLNIHALQKVAIPLPARDTQWLPSKILVDGRAATAMYRASDGVLWLELPRGRFNVMLSGSLKFKKHIQLPLQLRPRIVQSKLLGWAIDGVQKNGVPDSQLQLTREQQSAMANNALQNDQAEVLPPFLSIERHLKLGLDWFVETTIRRKSPRGSAVVVNIPLLKGESIITDGIRSKGGKVFVNMSARQNRVFWRSRIEKSDVIKLKASTDNFSRETWKVSVSPVWHLEYSGIPVIKHKTTQGRWAPQWRPFQGEEVNLTISRPQGVNGNTLTIEKSHLQIKPSKRTYESKLDVVLRSSQGGQYSLALPKDSNLQSVKINNTAQSSRLDGGNLTLPIIPGKQSIQIVWRNNDAMSFFFKTPQLNLKAASVNHSINVKFPQDRWVLFVGGPNMGPAILLWGVLIVVLLLAIGLGFTSITPLKTVSWILLGIGLSQVPVWMGFIVVAWLFMLGLRERMIKEASDIVFNVIQIAIGALTFLALICLFVVIQQGLLGSPDMQVSGNGSSAFNFNWYQDRNTASLPQAWLWSVPIIIYRLLMLAWALWLAFSLLRWLKWGWQQFCIDGLWRDISADSKTPTKDVLEVSTTKKLPALDDESNK